MASKTRIEDTRGKIDFSQSAEPTLNSEETKTGWFFIDWLVKGINFNPSTIIINITLN